jgi:hypothetical protein
MRTLFLAIAALALASPAHANDEKWENDCRRGWMSKTFKPDVFETLPEAFFNDDGTITIRIPLDDALEIQKLIPDLKAAGKFWQCVRDRDDGKVKHCYNNDKRWAKAWREGCQ